MNKKSSISVDHILESKAIITVIAFGKMNDSKKISIPSLTPIPPGEKIAKNPVIADIVNAKVMKK